MDLRTMRRRFVADLWRRLPLVCPSVAPRYDAFVSGLTIGNGDPLPNSLVAPHRQSRSR